MKAPEKIQVHLIKNDDYWSIRGYSFLEDKQFGMTEYTRTDAFIEKACGWLKSNLYDYAGEDDKRNIVPFDNSVFEDFRKAMEE